MRTFVIGWVVAFCLVALGAAGVGRLVASAPTSPAPPSGRQTSSVEDLGEAGPFTEAEAVEVVARRFAATRAGDQLRQEIRSNPTISYYSPAHWRVCVDADSACWIAHGPGHYAEPENDGARRREVLAANSR